MIKLQSILTLQTVKNVIKSYQFFTILNLKMFNINPFTPTVVNQTVPSVLYRRMSNYDFLNLFRTGRLKVTNHSINNDLICIIGYIHNFDFINNYNIAIDKAWGPFIDPLTYRTPYYNIRSPLIANTMWTPPPQQKYPV